jgi:molecular chaperone GrpE
LEETGAKDGRLEESQQTVEPKITEEFSVTEDQAGGDKREAEMRIQDLNDKYIRLYAEFENYKKRVSKEKEELVKYANEALLYALLPAIDHLELALKHSSCDPSTGVVQGVEITLKELQRTLEKFGLSRIEAVGKHFDPAFHHAMIQVEREDLDEKTVAEELRAGYLYYDKVLRPSLVAVSVRPKKTAEGARNEKNMMIEEEQ